MSLLRLSIQRPFVVLPSLVMSNVYISSQCRREFRLEYFFAVHAHRGDFSLGSLTWIDRTISLVVLCSSKMHAFDHYSKLSI
jgi:hypothetical protein